ncbi:MAG: YeiH family protein, partial [Bacteroidota bacterium]
AVAAAAPISEADEETTTLAVALMGILGTLGVFYYLFLAPHLGFTHQGLGILTGSTLQEVAQVMAAAFTWGPESGDLATLVKLTRVALLAPTLLVLGALLNRKKPTKGFDWKEPPLPYFVLGFLLMGGINSFGWLSSWQAALTKASILLMAFAMAGMGLRIDLARVRKTGWAAIWVGGIGFLGLSLLAYALIRALGVQ